MIRPFIINIIQYKHSDLMDVEDIGRLVRRQRRKIGLRQAELAALADVGTRFVSELEHGKSSLEIGRVFRVVEAVGLNISVERRSWGTLLLDR